MDNPRRCQSLKINRDPCRRWALRGSNYCQFHGGRSGKRVRNHHLPTFYSSKLTRTLSAAVEECLDKSPHEQLNLFEELALMRVQAGDAVKLYGAALELSDDNPAAPELQTDAGLIMRDSLKDVISTCEAAARIEAASKDRITLNDVAFIVAQIVRIAYEVFDDDMERAQQFEVLVRDKVKITDGGRGTDITPDQDVQDMDGTIPREPNDGDTVHADSASSEDSDLKD